MSGPADFLDTENAPFSELDEERAGRIGSPRGAFHELPWTCPTEGCWRLGLLHGEGPSVM